MRYSCVFTAMVTAAVVFAPQTTRTANAQASVRPPVAVVDMAYIFKNHSRFNQMKDALKQEVEREEANVTSLRESARRLSEQLQQMPKGSPEYKEQERRLADMTADLKVQVELSRKEFLEREARDYYAIYQEVAQEIDFFCQQNGIALVLRFSGDPIDHTNPQEILKELNKSVIYYNRSIDITPNILQAVNSRSPRQAQGGAVPGGGRQGVPRQPR